MELRQTETVLQIRTFGDPFDLWLLTKLISPGDLVQSETLRRREISNEEMHKAEKIPVRLTIEAQKIEHEQDAGHERVRILGSIYENLLFHGHHSLIFEQGVLSELEITKQTLSPKILYYLNLIATRKQGHTFRVLSLSHDLAVLAELSEHSIRTLAQVTRLSRGKQQNQSKLTADQYETELRSMLESFPERISIICGLGSFKESFVRRTKLIHEQLIDTNSEGIAAIHELLETSTHREQLANLLIGRQMRSVEQILAILGGQQTDEGAEYGISGVRESLDHAKEVLISDSAAELEEYVALLEEIQQRSIPYTLIQDDTPAGQKLNGLGGIAAILFYQKN